MRTRSKLLERNLRISDQRANRWKKTTEYKNHVRGDTDKTLDRAEGFGLCPCMLEKLSGGLPRAETKPF